MKDNDPIYRAQQALTFAKGRITTEADDALIEAIEALLDWVTQSRRQQSANTRSPYDLSAPRRR